MSRMARFLGDFSRQNPKVYVTFRIIDGDNVELKNLVRQPFGEEDIGRNKAVVLAEAAKELIASPNVEVKSYPYYLTPDNVNMIRGGNNCYESIQILVGAVDNHACRKLLHDYFLTENEYHYFFYLDAANEMSVGEIVIGKKKWGGKLAPDRAHYYPEILTDTEKPVYEMSCEELNSVEPQHLATNGMAADLLFSFIAQLMSCHEYAENVSGGIVYFNTFKMWSRFDKYEEVRHEENKQLGQEVAKRENNG